MTPEQAVDAIRGGNLVECEPSEWPAVRRAIQDAAARALDEIDVVRAQIILMEVKRLDEKFDEPNTPEMTHG